ncbi:hypothetical protein GNP80_06465 [Aliivibrio fischeri]|uniref:hypothetical protein n=1 Tax=Aliivibrio fischeri TaxID=668 RepID=UPI0012D89272|nr:hypothetical protein [Aliivibrio fischeri]MUK92082.1 hypothetical protein [Aliivibrio fischeri]
MAKLGYCKIDNLYLSVKSKHAYNEIKDVMQSANLLSGTLAFVPVIQVFASGSPFETAVTIREYDWEEFAEVMGSVPPITKERIRYYAEQMTWVTKGDEYIFWRCVNEAAN